MERLGSNSVQEFGGGLCFACRIPNRGDPVGVDHRKVLWLAASLFPVYP